jgi:hypothetical protein
VQDTFFFLSCSFRIVSRIRRKEFVKRSIESLVHHRRSTYPNSSKPSISRNTCRRALLIVDGYLLISFILRRSFHSNHARSLSCESILCSVHRKNFITYFRWSRAFLRLGILVIKKLNIIVSQKILDETLVPPSQFLALRAFTRDTSF